MKNLKIGFVHPDLGIGGAERLIVDAAVGLQDSGHEVVVYTSFYDPLRAFSETKDLKITTVGDFITLQRFKILVAVLKSWILGLYILISTLQDKQDVLIVDQVSASIPILKLTGSKIIFYGHFPDQLLTKRETLIKRLYRLPFDFLEKWTTKMADLILVNSFYTRQIFKSQFNIEPKVLYPAINLKQYEIPIDSKEVEISLNEYSVLSVNRFERKKNIEMAILAYNDLKLMNRDLYEKTGLVLAGGYDQKVLENVEYLKELEELCDELGLAHSRDTSKPCQVLFIPSFTQEQRGRLFRDCSVLVYTPTNEHFGIVPIEAMYSKLPVIACNSGGPLETIIEDETGFVVEPKHENFASKIIQILSNKPKRISLGNAGRRHVMNKFSLETFIANLENELNTCEYNFTGLIFAYLIYSLVAIIPILIAVFVVV